MRGLLPQNLWRRKWFSLVFKGHAGWKSCHRPAYRSWQNLSNMWQVRPGTFVTYCVICRHTVCSCDSILYFLQAPLQHKYRHIYPSVIIPCHTVHTLCAYMYCHTSCKIFFNIFIKGQTCMIPLKHNHLWSITFLCRSILFLSILKFKIGQKGEP